MIGTLFRFLLLRVLGGRAATALALVGVVLGWRGRRKAQRAEADRLGTPGVDRTNGPGGPTPA